MKQVKVAKPREVNFRRVDPSFVKSSLDKFRGRSERIDRLLSDGEAQRISLTASRIPIASHPEAHLVDLGGTIFWLPIYVTALGYRNVTIVCRPDEAHFEPFQDDELRRIVGQDFNLKVVGAEIDVDTYPIEDESVDCVVSFEVLEHLPGDPMHMFSESNRILKSGGRLFLTTPNVQNSDNVLRYLFGHHPFGWSVFTHYYADRHNREYTPWEIQQMIALAGFDLEFLITQRFGSAPDFMRRLVGKMLCVPAAVFQRVEFSLREPHILAMGVKIGGVVERFPSFLYELYGHSSVSHPFRR